MIDGSKVQPRAPGAGGPHVNPGCAAPVGGSRSARLRMTTLVVATHRDHVLLLHRRREPNRGLWSPPGGKIEPGETPLASAVREFSEETGLDLVAPRLVALVSELDEARSEAWLMFVYRGTAEGPPRDGPEGSTAWIRRGDVAALPTPPADDAILDIALRGRPRPALLQIAMHHGELVTVRETSFPSPGGPAGGGATPAG